MSLLFGWVELGFGTRDLYKGRICFRVFARGTGTRRLSESRVLICITHGTFQLFSRAVPIAWRGPRASACHPSQWHRRGPRDPNMRPSKPATGTNELGSKQRKG